MKSLNVLCFTKDRPLQFTGYVESLLHYSGMTAAAITVIYRRSPIYDQMCAEYPQIRWVPETSEKEFDSALRMLASEYQDDDVILFGCDDVVYMRAFNPIEVREKVTSNLSEGFCLRRGGILPLVPGTKFCYGGKFKYPFELMATACSGFVFKGVVSNSSGVFRLPNDLEAWGFRYTSKNRLMEYMWMYSGTPPAAGQDVNRVQQIYANNIVRGTDEHSVENLLNLYERGFRLDWTNCADLNPHGVFLGARYWKLRPPK